MRIKCSCGKVLSIKDELAGKAVKCPGCQKVLKVPAPKSAPAKPAQSAPAPPSPAPPAGAPGFPGPGSATPFPGAPATPGAAPAGVPGQPADTGLGVLFDEEGFEQKTGPVCPSCMTELKPGAVICVNCGFNGQTGAKMEGYLSPEEASATGNLELDKAITDIERDRKLSEQMKQTGMSAWMLFLTLIAISALASAGVLFVMNVNSVGGMKPLYMGFFVCALCAGTISTIKFWQIVYMGFQENRNQGLLVMLVPLYVLIYAISRWKKVGGTFMAYFGWGFLAGSLMMLAALFN